MTKRPKRTHPMELVTRFLLLKKLREFDPQKVHTINSLFVIEMENEEGKSFYEMDWETCLFKISNHMLEKVIDGYLNKYGDKKPGIISGVSGENEGQVPKLDIITGS